VSGPGIASNSLAVRGERILVLEADTVQRGAMLSALRQEGFDVSEAASAEAGLEALRGFAFDGVFLPARTPGWSAPAIVSLARGAGSDAAFVVGCTRETLDLAIQALRAGADAYVVRPTDGVRACAAVERAMEKRRLRLEARQLRDRIRSRLLLVGQSPESRALEDMVRRAAPTRATVLLVGEPGTGKSLVAQMIHESSPRRDRPFVRMSCAALSEPLLESLLFGAEKGALPDVPGRRTGLLEAADGGTLYLQEVAQLPPALQVKLLRVLQQGEFERLGGREVLRVDVRIVASTRRDLAHEVRAGRFRDDLFYRLNVVVLPLPPLHARKGDLPALAGHFASVRAREVGKSIRGLTPGALSALFAYEWPGNVRELEDVVSRAVDACAGDQVGVEDLPPVLHGARLAQGSASALIPGASLFEIEREAVLRTLEAVGGSTVRAAAMLGVSVRKIQYRLKEYRTGQQPVRQRLPDAEEGPLRA
jgi:DNA-binding NtrC family response regulator